MVRSILIAGVLTVAVAIPAQAQTRVEASVNGGYTFSEGIGGDPVVTPSGTFSGIDIKSGASAGFSVAVITENGGEVGFTWGRQLSTMGMRGVPTVEIGDMNIDHYHAHFAYNALRDRKAQPYLSIGFGATDYGAVGYTTPSQAGEISGPLKFSMKVGAGIKTWVNDWFAFRTALNWTPTRISSQEGGWWCDPYWGCYLAVDSKFSHQFELSGGVVFRFGSN